MTVFATDVNGNPRDLILMCDITDSPGNVTYTWYRGDQELPEDLVDQSTGTLTIANITEGEYASRDGVSYYCVATRAIGKNSYNASVRSRTVFVHYACEFEC